MSEDQSQQKKYEGTVQQMPIDKFREQYGGLPIGHISTAPFGFEQHPETGDLIRSKPKFKAQPDISDRFIASSSGTVFYVPDSQDPEHRVAAAVVYGQPSRKRPPHESEGSQIFSNGQTEQKSRPSRSGGTEKTTCYF